jgi:flagellar biosynthesis/type III secretory pathway M-ring protein FliF/YscJ
VTATALLASHPGPATHLALLGIIVVVGVTVFAVVRIRNKREAEEAERFDQAAEEAPSPEQEPESR